MSKPVYAWKWMNSDMKFRYGDGRKLTKEKTSVTKPVVLCNNGFHASRKIYQSMFYRDYMTKLCLVKLSGQIIDDGNKICGEHIELIEKFHVADKVLRPYRYRSNLFISKKLELLVIELAEKRGKEQGMWILHNLLEKIL